MYSSANPSPSSSWLVIDSSHEGELRFASVRPDVRPVLGSIMSVPVAGYPTFTDALQQYERESEIPLQGRECVLGMAGAVNGEMLNMVRSRWTITRTGMAAVFGRPVAVLNDVACMAWAARSNSMRAEPIRGLGQPAMGRAGRMLLLLVDEGVGACAIDIDEHGRLTILESECGHVDFAPASDDEEALAKAVKGLSPTVSWEKMLTLDSNDPIWAQACPRLVSLDRGNLLSAMLGRYAVNLMHAFAAWQGVMVAGSRGHRMLGGEFRRSFDAQFMGRRNFSRLVMATPVWRTEFHEAVLTGGAEMLAQKLSTGDPLARAA